MKKKIKEIKPNYNENWIVAYEYKFGRDVIVPGTELKFKYDRGTYKFEKFVINTKTNTEWIDVVSQQGYRSFYTKDLKGIVKPKIKKSRKKND